MDVSDVRSAIQLAAQIVTRELALGGLGTLSVGNVREEVELVLGLRRGALRPYRNLLNPVIDLVIDGAEWRTHVPPIRGACPVAELPSELICEIFLHIVTEWEQRRSAGLPAPSSQLIGTLRSITSVCKHWRLAAFGCPSLWRNVLGGRLDSYGTTKKRAVMLSSAVKLNVWGEGNDTLNDLLDNLVRWGVHDRIGRLAIGQSEPVRTALLSPLHSWPVLDYLSVETAHTSSQMSSLLCLLRLQPALRELRVNSVGTGGPLRFHIALGSVKLARLEKLVVLFNSSFILDGLLSWFALPVLVELVVLRRRNEFLLEDESDLMLRLHGKVVLNTVTVLALGGFAQADDILKCVIRAPRSTVLKLVHVPDVKVVEKVTTATRYGGCLPFLRSLYIDAAVFNGEDARVIQKQVGRGVACFFSPQLVDDWIVPSAQKGDATWDDPISDVMMSRIRY